MRRSRRWSRFQARFFHAKSYEVSKSALVQDMSKRAEWRIHGQIPGRRATESLFALVPLLARVWNKHVYYGLSMPVTLHDPWHVGEGNIYKPFGLPPFPIPLRTSCIPKTLKITDKIDMWRTIGARKIYVLSRDVWRA